MVLRRSPAGISVTFNNDPTGHRASHRRRQRKRGRAAASRWAVIRDDLRRYGERYRISDSLRARRRVVVAGVVPDKALIAAALARHRPNKGSRCRARNSRLPARTAADHRVLDDISQTVGCAYIAITNRVGRLRFQPIVDVIGKSDACRRSRLLHRFAGINHWTNLSAGAMQHDTVRDRKSLVQPVNLNYRYAIAKRLKLTTGYFDTWRRGITHVGHLNGHTLATILGIIDNVVQV